MTATSIVKAGQTGTAQSGQSGPDGKPGGTSVVPAAQGKAVQAASGNVVRLNPVNAVAHRVQLAFGSTGDQEFLPAAVEILQTPPSPRRLALTWLMCGALAVAVIWACVAQLDIYATASGRVQPSGRSKVIQPFETGKVKAILVSNGSQVKAGDLLIETDPTDNQAEYDAASDAVQALDGEIARRQTEIASVLAGARAVTPVAFPASVNALTKAREQNVLDAELGQLIASRDSLSAQRNEKSASMSRFTQTMNTRRDLISVLQERYQTRNALSTKQAVTRATVLDAKQQLDTELTNLANDQGEWAEAEAATRSFDSRIAQLTKQFLADQQQKLATAQQKRDQAVADLVKAQSKLDRTHMRAPIDGTVQQLAVTTVGQVVTTGQPLAVIVPTEDKIEIEALMPDSDIGFIEPGQEAVIKIAAFPFTRYGTLGGKITRVSREAVDAREAMGTSATATPTQQNGTSLNAVQSTQNLVFPVTVELDQSTIEVDGKKVPLVAGMTASVEVRTGARRVISYVLQPLAETTSEAGHER